jgi:catalase
MQMGSQKGRVAYEPSRLSADSPRENAKHGFRSFGPDESGQKGRIRAESFADHYSQARQFFRSQSAPEQAHIASSLVFELSKVQTAFIRESMVGHLRQIDESLAQRVANGLGLDELPPSAETTVVAEDRPNSPALQIIGKMKATLEGRCVGVLVNDGSDGRVVAALRKAAIAAGASVKIVAPKIGGAKLADGSRLPADGQLAGTPSMVFDAVAVVLSDAGAAALAKDGAAIDFVRNAFGHLKAIAIDAGGQTLLQAAGIVPDAGVIAAHDISNFIDAAMTRQWDREPHVRTLA